MNAEPAPQRLVSLDAFRGFIMVLMASGGFGIPKVAEKLPGSFWSKIDSWFEHAEWAGGVLWDMIQPSFMFMVGVAAAYSCAKRLERGDAFSAVLRHAAVRSIVLVLLAVLVASNWAKQTNWVFTNVLGQIGLGYFFLVLLTRASLKTQCIVFTGILVGYWALFAFWPESSAPANADYSWWKHTEPMTGFLGHWNPHRNPAAVFDRWFLNLFPRSEAYVSANGGYQTLNFIPSLATMLLGLMTGNYLRSAASPSRKLRDLLIAAVVCLALGFIAGQTVCPIVKRIWTPSWVLWSAGWVLLMLAFFYFVIDLRGAKKWATPLIIVGMNSIVMYLGYQLCAGWIRETLARDLWHPIEKMCHVAILSGPYQAMVERCSVLLVLWLFCWWLYRQRVFIRI